MLPLGRVMIGSCDGVFESFKNRNYEKEKIYLAIGES